MLYFILKTTFFSKKSIQFLNSELIRNKQTEDCQYYHYYRRPIHHLYHHHHSFLIFQVIQYWNVNDINQHDVWLKWIEEDSKIWFNRFNWKQKSHLYFFSKALFRGNSNFQSRIWFWFLSCNCCCCCWCLVLWLWLAVFDIGWLWVMIILQQF